MSHHRLDAPAQPLPILALGVVLCLLTTACGGGGTKDAVSAPPKRFPVPLFDGLWLGMTRDEAARVHPVRPALTSAGRSRRVWIYDRPGEFGTELTFGVNRPDAPLERIDVHFGADEAAAQHTIEALARTLGEP